MENIVFGAITKHGTKIVRKLGEHFPQADVFYMSKFAYGDEEEKGFGLFEGSVRKHLSDWFQTYDGIVMVVSLGAVVRMVGPLVKDKKTDPAVVVIDDKGKYVISVLSGHLGGANELTKQVAANLDAEPVITTASEAQQTIPVDIWGKSFGWTVEDFKHVTPVSASVVNEEPVAIVQEAGEKDWWTSPKPLPSHFHVTHDLEEAEKNDPKAALIISHRHIDPANYPILNRNHVIYRPKVIHLGIGCNRGTSAEEIEQVIDRVLVEQRLSKHSVKKVATITLKKDEQGLIDVCEKNGWPFVCYEPEELNQAPMKNPSDTVYKYTGAYGVSEPAAVLSAGADEPLLEKEKDGNVTVSIAIEDFE